MENYAKSNFLPPEINIMETFMFKTFPDVIKELYKLNFPIYFDDKKTGDFFVTDFYNSEALRLNIDQDGVVRIFDKDGFQEILTNVDQVVKWNYHWWLASSGKRKGYPDLTQFWSEEFRKRKWLKKVYIWQPNVENYQKFIQGIDVTELEDEDKETAFVHTISDVTSTSEVNINPYLDEEENQQTSNATQNLKDEDPDTKTEEFSL